MRDYWENTKFDLAVSSDAMRWTPEPSAPHDFGLRHAPQPQDDEPDDEPLTFLEDLW